MTRPERGWTLTGGTAAALVLGVVAAASMGTATQRALAVAPPGSANCTLPATPSGSASVTGTKTWDAVTGVTAAPITSTISNLSGIPTNAVVRDVDVKTLIESKASGDLTIKLTHGSKTVVLLTPRSSRRAWDGHNDLWANTTWDDQAATPVMTTNHPETIVAAVSPEGKLAAFNGDQATGPWTLSVSDTRLTEPGDDPTAPIPDEPQDGGSFNGWSIDVKASATAPIAPATGTFSSTGTVSIPDGTRPAGAPADGTGDVAGAEVSQQIPVNLQPGQRITDIAVETTIPFDRGVRSDLKLTLVSPSGTQILLSPGGAAFGTPDFAETANWADGNSKLVADGSGNDGQSSLQPVGALSRLIGEEAGGTWLLKAQDKFNGDVGQLASTKLTIKTSRGCATDLATTVGAANTPATTGSTATVNFTLANLAPNGAGADNATFELEPSTGLQIVSVNGAAYTAGSALSAGSLANTGAGASKAFAVVVKATAAGSYTLKGTSGLGAPQQGDTNGGNNSATGTIVFSGSGGGSTNPGGGTTNPGGGTTNPGGGGGTTTSTPLSVTLAAKNFSVKAGGKISTRVTLTKAGSITLQLKKGKKVVKTARFAGKVGKNTVSLKVGRTVGTYQLVVRVVSGGTTVTKTGTVKIRRK